MSRQPKMLDVHVLLMDYTKPEFHSELRRSIEAAVAAAGYPVAVHYLPGFLGHLGKARAAGYAKGTHPYVTHVDDDDFIREDAFAILKEQLEKNVDGITTGETRLFDSGNRVDCPNDRHHLAVYRRELVEASDYAKFRFFPDQFLMRGIKTVHIPECVYVHRIRERSGSRILRSLSRSEEARERQILDRPDLVAVEMMSQKEIARQYDDWLNENNDKE